MKNTLSGLQKEVLGLYRTIIREALKKDRKQALVTSSSSSTSSTSSSPNSSGETITTTTTSHPTLFGLWKDPYTSSFYAKDEFRKQVGSVKRSDFRTIEYKLRHGYKQVKLLQMPGVKIVGRPPSSGN